jgi:hypothetical protein
MASILLGYTPLFFKLLIIAIAIVPFVFTNIIKSRDYWLIIGLGATLYVSKIPLPILDALHIGYLVNAMLLGLLFAELAMKKLVLPRIFDTFPNRCMALFAMIITARFMIDRPGSGAMGGTGGLSSALPALLAGWCFFSIYVLARDFKISIKQFRILYAMAIIGLVHIIYKNAFYFMPKGHFISIFPYPSVWVIGFFPLSNLMHKIKEKDDITLNIKIYAISVVIILLSVISKNRAPILYAPAALLVIYWCYRKVNRYIIIVFLGLLTLITATTFFPSAIPKSAVRTLSLVSSQLTNSTTDEYGETGWQSDWRATLARIAWEDIKRHPITGKGFAFSFEELQYNAQIASTGDAGRFGGLLSSGGYHNSILFLAVKVGIPAALVFVLALINIFYRFLKFSRYTQDEKLKPFCVGLSAVFVCTLAKMLTNGGPIDAFSTSIIMATMQGILMGTKNYKHKELDTL